MKKETYKERLKNGVGVNIVRFSDCKKTGIYSSDMANCHFRHVNVEGENKFSLIETDDPSTFTFHFESVFITDASVSVLLGEILKKDFNLIKKARAMVSLYKFWHNGLCGDKNEKH